ncbi:unnamed protein product [Oncorhynchus mykiss]|uniref:TRIM8/14/16/25/29/45/65 coiled-coil region domain-containing protein n=1 Tax=Oncorhynchus mykiss TaxID=8022 RepID=A0A060XGD7_ONCMY|nr:unnamed protein product [Oncorhynchus mykiss]
MYNLDECSISVGEVACDDCSTRKLKALKSCLVCLTSYCETHLEHHQRVVNLKRHKLIDPAENLEDRMSKKHERLLELFCRTDQMCVCFVPPRQTTSLTILCPLKTWEHTRRVSLRPLKQRLKRWSRSDRRRWMKSNTLWSSVGKVQTKILRTVRISSPICRVRRTNLKQVMEAMQTATEKRAEGLVNDLEQEITELQRRSTELEQLSHTEDHLHFLQAKDCYTYLHDWSEICVYSDLCVGTVRRALSIKVEIFKRVLKTLTDLQCTKNAQVLSNNPERFDIYTIKGINSGCHYWEVQVGLRNDWDVGIAKETEGVDLINRKEEVQINSAHGFFALGKYGFDYKVHSSPLRIFI